MRNGLIYSDFLKIALIVTYSFIVFLAVALLIILGSMETATLSSLSAIAQGVFLYFFTRFCRRESGDYMEPAARRPWWKISDSKIWGVVVAIIFVFSGAQSLASGSFGVLSVISVLITFGVATLGIISALRA